MPSWQSYLVHPVLRFQVKRRLARAATPQAARSAFNNALPPPKGARFQPDIMGGIGGEWVDSDHTGAGTILYLHGGGYFACSAKTHRPITAAYALRGFKVFAPDYRLAPEHPFPAAVDDALACYRAMLDIVPASGLVISGDSAGGGLALATLLAAKAAHLPMPACAVLFSPWTDLAGTGESVTTNARRDSMLYAPRLREAGANYLSGADPKTPLASPLYGDLTGLPALLIQVGAPEILLDDSTRLAAAARAAGVPVDISIWQNLPHVWQMMPTLLPEARRALDEAASFINRA
ncbi:MAG: alpha/beta hydrolase fold domain-containing protein [Acidocella sp.]|nr:alpha/beta hydrolase fold domain-containing protein [Acidocella sp.]